ncbi:MAG TPA: type IV secretory system conjugative DNA transfer family protein [Symbiobacteriaceae bacterium]|nr:type IV secretory system conjugative DNA transfer family protein [Symbiobacteriaceae bacterium]
MKRIYLIIGAGLAFADFITLPWAMWSGPGPYRPWYLVTQKELTGEWFVLNLAAVIAVLTWYSKRNTNPKAPEDASHYGSHGSTRFAHPHELRSYLKREGPGLILGRAKDGLLTLPPDPTLPYNQNVTILGSSGSRKTRSFVQPNLLQEALHGQASLVCMDPKSENYKRSAHLLKRAGYEVRLLNFLDMAHSDRWNPLDAVQTTTDAADLAVNIVANTVNPNRPAGGDPFWDQAEQSFITALILYVKQHRPKEEQHMASVLELGSELHPKNLDYLFLRLDQNAPARRFYRTFLRADEKVRAGVVAGIGSRLQLWNIPEVISLTAASDFSLADLGTKKIALFLVVPDSKATYAPILALFWQQTFQQLYDVADKHGGALPNPVRCVMDEIANCGYIPDYALKKSTMRSRRISTEEIWQSLGQMKNRYPQSWSELLANSDHLLILGVNDLDTAQYVSQLTGTTTLSIVGTGATEGSTGGSSSSSRTYIGRPLLTPDEIRRLPSEQALLLPKANFPARLTKVDFTLHPKAKEIVEEDHRAYPAPERTPPVVIDVAKILTEITPQQTEAPPTTATAEDTDLTDFANEGPKQEGGSSR